MELVIPFFMNRKKNSDKVEVVRNHEIFHYFHLIQRQKIYCMDSKTQRTFGRIIRDYIPAFRSLLGEPKRVVLSHEYWEDFMRSRQKLIPMDEVIEEEFFHLEKLIFQSLKDEVFEDKYEFIYFIFSLYLLYLKIIVDVEVERCEEEKQIIEYRV